MIHKTGWGQAWNGRIVVFRKSIVIFSGYNQRAIISFLRVAQKHNIPFIIIAKSETDSILDTAYKKYVKYVRKKTELDLINIKCILDEIKSKGVFDEYVILPSTEYLNRFLLKNKKELKEMNITVPLVDEQIYHLVSDKYSFGNLCKKNGIKTPQELSINEVNSFPVVVKPRCYFTSDGKIISPQIIKDMPELINFMSQNCPDDFYMQQYIKGESYYLLYYFCKDGKFECFSQKNILQQSRGKSIIAAVPADIHEKDISKKFVELFKSINFTGLVMVELRFFDGEYYMIEANPRLWGPSQLFVDSGKQFFELFLYDCGFNVQIDKSSCPRTNTKYFWMGGLVETLYRYGEIVFHIEDHNLFEKEFRYFLSNDVYLRDDTENIFAKEILSLTRGG